MFRVRDLVNTTCTGDAQADASRPAPPAQLLHGRPPSQPQGGHSVRVGGVGVRLGAEGDPWLGLGLGLGG
eukprot:scaffold40537_cov54-Phaeocystis_antarctica.AAC.3